MRVQTHSQQTHTRRSPDSDVPIGTLKSNAAHTGAGKAGKKSVDADAESVSKGTEGAAAAEEEEGEKAMVVELASKEADSADAHMHAWMLVL